MVTANSDYTLMDIDRALPNVTRLGLVWSEADDWDGQGYGREWEYLLNGVGP